MSTVSQAGSIAVRGPRGGREFLLVTAKQSPDEWIFPKGHVEREETEAEAALRELEEEAGFVGMLLAPVGALDFTSAEGPVHVEYFLVAASRRTGPGDGRAVEWLPSEAARARLTHDDARLLFDRAVERLREL